jgi:hypothetical protein
VTDELEALLYALVQACENFDATVNFYMDDDAWDALAVVQDLCDRVRARDERLAERGGKP